MEALVGQGRLGAPLHPARGAPGRSLQWGVTLPSLSPRPSDGWKGGSLAARSNAARLARNGGIIRISKAAAPAPGSQRRGCRLESLPAREGAPADNQFMLHCLF